MQSGKSPGPDGFTDEFYKSFASLLTPTLTMLYSDFFFTTGRLPPTLSEASISLLLKKDKDPTSCGSYRPISLNVDFRILAKVLCSRLETLLPSLISHDQTDFTPGRHSFFNSRKLLNILFSPPSDSPEIIPSLDAEKAFNRVEWDYLFFFFGQIWI